MDLGYPYTLNPKLHLEFGSWVKAEACGASGGGELAGTRSLHDVTAIPVTSITPNITITSITMVLITTNIMFAIITNFAFLLLVLVLLFLLCILTIFAVIADYYDYY